MQTPDDNEFMPLQIPFIVQVKRDTYTFVYTLYHAEIVRCLENYLKNI